MKKILLLFVLAGSFIGCSGDDAPSINTYPDSLTGTWKSISFTKDGKTIDTSNCENPTNDEAYFWTLVFKNDKTFEILHTCDPTIPLNEYGTYEYSKGMLTNTHVGDWINKYNVTVLEDNKIGIKLFWSNSTGDIDGEYMILQKQ